MCATAAAVEELAKLHHRETIDKLKTFLQGERGEQANLTVMHSESFLSTQSPTFWCACFVRLFPRGDCSEVCPGRPTVLPRWRWAKSLLTRADAPHLRRGVEFVASLYNIFLRRDLVKGGSDRPGVVKSWMR